MSILCQCHVSAEPVQLHEDALRQAGDTGQILLVEGCFDVAKLHAAGIRNVVASFGAHLSPEQAARLELIGKTTGVQRFLVWYDRDQNGSAPQGLGALHARDLIVSQGFTAELFDWNRRFSSPKRSDVTIPPEITDPCEFSVEQLRWLRFKSLI